MNRISSSITKQSIILLLSKSTPEPLFIVIGSKDSFCLGFINVLIVEVIGLYHSASFRRYTKKKHTQTLCAKGRDEDLWIETMNHRF